MKEINGIKTNLGSNYSIGNGKEPKTGRLYIRENYDETDEQMFERLSQYGFKKITFYRCTTMIRGIYSLYALCYD